MQIATLLIACDDRPGRVSAFAQFIAANGGSILDADQHTSVKERTRLGRDVERQVLARAVRWHLERRIIIHGNRTVVFA